MQDNRATSTRKNIRFNNELLAMIDKARGSEAFGSWVQNACRESLKGNSKVTPKDTGK